MTHYSTPRWHERTRWLLALVSMVWLVPMLLGNTAAAQYLSENFNGTWNNNQTATGAPTGWSQSYIMNTTTNTVTPPTVDGTQAWFQLRRESGSWSVSYTSSGESPTRRPDNSALQNGDHVAFMADYFYQPNIVGSIGTRLVSPIMNLVGSTDPHLSYDFWHHGRTGNSPPFRVEISTNNGSSWEVLAYGVPPQGSGYQWNTQGAAIPAAYRQASVRIAFTFFGFYGVNNLAIDNVVVDERSAFSPLFFRTKASGNTSALGTWESATTSGGPYTDATRFPGPFDYVTVQATHTLTLNATGAGSAPFPQAVQRYGDLTVNGTLTFSSSAAILMVTNNTTVNSGGTLLSGTTTSHMYLGGNLVNNGTTSLSTSTTAVTVFHGLNAATVSGTGTFGGPNIASIVVINKPTGLTFSQTANLQLRNELWGMAGTVTHSNNVTIGISGQNLTINKAGNFDFATDPVYATFASGNLNYSITAGTASASLWGTPSRGDIVPGREVPLVGGVRNIRSTFTMNHHGTATLNYPLQVGTTSTGVGTFTRGILNTTVTNPLIIAPNVTTLAGTFMSTPTSNVKVTSATHGSYVNGPVRVQVAAGTTQRVIALGYGANLWDTLNNRSGNAIRRCTLRTGATAWANQDLTIVPVTNISSTTPGVAPFNNRGFQIIRNSGDLSSTADLILQVGVHTYAQGGETFPAGTVPNNLRAVQATSASGPWVVRGSGSGASVAENTLYACTTATSAPGPIAPLATNGDFFAVMVNGATPGTVAATTPVTTAVSQGDQDVNILRVNIPVNVGGGSLTLNSLGITGTFTAGDVVTAKVFAGTISGPTGPALATINSPTTAMNFTGMSSALAGGDNYFWVTYTIAGSVNGTSIRADLNAGGVGLAASGGADASGTLPAALISGTARNFADPVIITPAGSTTICSGGSGVGLTASSVNPSYTYTWSPAAGLSATTGATVTANPTTTTTYTVTGTDGPITTTRTVTITVNQTTVGSVSSSNGTSICVGSSTQLRLAAAGGTVQVGTGTTQPAINETAPSPYAGYWGGQRTQFLYRASELGDLAAGAITAIGWQLTAQNSHPATLTGYTIRMANVSIAEMPTAFQAPTWTTVYGPVAEPRPAANATRTINLTTPFVWDGSSNILVEICFNNNNTGPTNGIFSYNGTNTSYQSCLAVGFDSNPNVCTAATGFNYTLRPNTIFTGNVANASNFTSVSWSPAAGLSATNIFNPVLTPNATGNQTYTASYVGTNGCASTAQITIDRLASPAAPVATPGAPLCGTQVPNVTFSVAGGADSLLIYTQASGGTPVEKIVSPANAMATYQVGVNGTQLWVAGKNNNGCEGPRTLFTISTLPAPALTITSNRTSNTICNGQDIELTGAGTGYVNFSWSRPGFPNFASTAVITQSPTATTVYTLEANDGSGCSNTTLVTVTVNPVPSAPNVTSQRGFTICQNTATQMGVTEPPVTIGTGTTSSGTTLSPFHSWFGNSRQQYLYLASELGAGLARNIGRIAWDVISRDASYTYTNYTIRMANVSVSGLGATFQSPTWTTVYTRATQAPPSVGLNDIILDAPFAWDGTSNVLVEVCFNNNISSLASSTPVNTTTTAFASVTVRGVDGNVPDICTNNSGNTISTARPNARFTFVGGYVAYSWSPAGDFSDPASATPLYTPTTSGSVTPTLTITAANGCQATTNVPFTVNPAPAAPTAATNVPHCGINVPNVTINTTGMDTLYVWSAPTGGTRLQRTKITGATTALAGFTMGAGSVWVNVKSTSGCEGPRGEIVITTTPAPALSAAIQGAYEVCANSNDPVTLVATGPAYNSFTWSRPGAANFATGASIVVDPAGTTTYTVVATDGSCNNEATVTVTRTLAVSISASTATPQVLTGGSVTLNTTFQQLRTSQQVGGGSVANAANSTVAGTMYSGWFGNAKHRYLFRAAELSAAGYSAGVIRQLITTIGTVGGPNTFNGYTVRMANTSITDLTTGSMANLGTSFSFTTVFGPVNRTISPNQEDVLTFTNNFVWDGTSNVLLEYCFSNGNSGTGTPVQPVVTTSFTSGAYTIADGDQGDYCENVTTGTRVSSRPNIRFTQAPGSVAYSWTGPGGFSSSAANPIFTAQQANSGQFTVTATVSPSNCQYTANVNLSVVPCPVVTDVVATATGSSTATVTWTAPFGAASYRVEAVPASLAIGGPIAINTTGTTANFTGLLPGIAYTFRVQTVCLSGARSQIVTANATTFLGNDEPCGARPLTVGFSVAPVTQNQALASTSGSAPVPTCKGLFQDYSRDLWYSVTAPSSGILAIYVSNVTSDRNLVDVFSGADCNSLGTSLACNAGTDASNTFQYVSGLTPGEPILIRVSASGLVGGTFSIAVAPGLLWTAATNNLWATAGNWYNNQIPTSTQQAVIPAKGTQPVVGSSTSVGSVNMEAGASLTLNATLTLSGGTSTFNGNTVTTAPGVALAMSGTNTIAGNLTVDTMAVSGTTNIANGASLTINRALRINASGTFNNTGTGSVLLNSGNGFTANLAPVGSGGSYNGNLTQRVWFPQPTTFAGRWYFFGMGVKNATLSNFATQWYTRGFANAWDPSGNSNVFFGNESATSGWSSATDASNALTPGRGVRVFPGAQIRNRSAWTVTGPPVVGNGVDQTNTGGTEAFSFGTLSKTAGTETVSGFHFLSNPYPAAINWTTTNWTRTNIEPTIHVWDAIAATYKTYNHITGVGTRGTAAQGGGILASGQGFMVQVGGTAPTTGSLSVTEAAKVGTTWNAYRQAVLPVRVKLEAAARPENHDEMMLGMMEDMTTGLDAETDARKLLGGALDVYMELNGEKTTVNFMSKPSSTLRIPVNFRSVATGAHSLSFSDVANLLQDNLSVTLVDNYLGTSTLLTGDVRYEFTVDASISATTADGRFELVVAPARVTNLAGNVNRAVFGVYPNPASSNSELSLVLNNYELTGKAAVVITDALGRVVMSERLNGTGAFNTWKLETGLAAGMYTVKVMAGSESFSQKLVVK